MVVSLALALAIAGEAPPQIGAFIPNSQLLSSCESKQPDEFGMCWGFIEGVVEATGTPGSKWPKGAIELPVNAFGPKLIPAVVAHIRALEPEKMSGPAAQSVYEAIVALYPYQPPASEPARK